MRKPQVVVALMVTLVALVSASGPAGAGTACSSDSDATNAPDAKLRLEDGPFFDAGEYPHAQTPDPGFVEIGDSVTYTIKWKNVSDTTRTIRVQRLFVQTEGYGTKIFVGGVNVKPAFRDEAWVAFSDVGAGKSITLTVVVKNRTATVQDQAIQYLRGRYSGAADDLCDAALPFVNNFG